MFIMTPLYTRWLSSGQYGLFDLLVTYATLLTPVITLASGEAVFRFTVDIKDTDKKEEIISTAFFLDLAGIMIAGITGILIGVFHPDHYEMIVCFLIYLTSEVLNNFLLMGIRGEKKLNIYTIANIFFVIGMSAFVTIFVYIFPMGLKGILLGYTMGNIVSILIMAFMSGLLKYIHMKKATGAVLAEIIRYSSPMIPNAISWWIINVSDRTFITQFLGVEYNAVYAIANKVPALCSSFFGVFHLSWQQSATEVMSDRDRDVYYSSVMNHMFGIVGSVCILLLGVNYWFFCLLFPAEYLPGIYHAPVLVIALIFSMLGQFIGGIYVAQMKSKKNGFTTAIAAVINIIIDFALIGHIGLFAASVSTLAAYLSLFVIRFLDIRKSIKMAFTKKSLVLALVLAYFAVSSYILTEAVQCFNCIFGLIMFIALNRSYFKKIKEKVLKQHESV
ncbi:MAG: polysaccharide biosynthesis C-terminal domain-containing protein [Bacteroides fragilis]|nr:polysaccharide biosynthesis C-terminal domain-containing protein [Bacteroides fragilis]